MDTFIYGKWDPKNNEIIFDEEKINLLQSRTVDNMVQCKECESRNHCAGYCLGEVLNETDSIFGCKQKICGALRYLDANMTNSQKKYIYTHP